MKEFKVYAMEECSWYQIIEAESEEQALRILEIMTGGQITPFSEIIKLEVHSIQ